MHDLLYRAMERLTTGEHLRDAGHLAPGDIVRVEIEDADEHDLFGAPA